MDGSSSPMIPRPQGSGGGCFRAGTRVSTLDGSKPIESLKVGDQVYAYDQQGRMRTGEISEVHQHENEALLRMEFWGGVIFVTPNHWMQNSAGSFTEAGTLTTHDALVDIRGHLRPIHSITPIEPETVYNLTVLPHHTFIADGIRVHNGGGGKGGGSARAAVEAPNTLRSNATARVLDLIGEGPIGGLVNGAQSIFFDDTPLENADGSYNFKGVVWDIRHGYPDQDPMSGFDEVEAETTVETAVTRQLGSIVRQVSEADADACRIRIRIPSLTLQDTTTGDMKPTSVEIKIEVKPSNGEYRDVTFVYNEVERTGQTTTVNNAVGFRLVVKKRVLVKLNSPSSVTLEARYRKSGAASWISLGARTVSAIIGSVADIATADGYIDGQPAYYHTFTTTYSLLDLGANSYEIGLVQGDEIVSFVAYTRSNLLVEGKNTAPTEKSYRFDLPGTGPWLVRLSRITPDSDSATLQNQTVWVSYTTIIADKFIYPDSAYIGLSVNASLFGNSIPARAYDVYGREVLVPLNYDPLLRIYTGFWDGTFKQAWTDNPAWCFLDMLTNDRFGLGDRIDLDAVDTAKLYEISQYCDELVPDGYGGFEPRFTLNCVINTQADAYQVLNSMVSNFWGMVYQSAGAVAFGIDAPREADVIVGRANVVDGEFNYSSSGDRARHNSVLVTWNNPNDGDRTDIEVVEDNADISARGLRQTDVYAFGCKSRGQASRYGKRLLYTEKYEQETVTYRCGLDHLNVVPGMVIGLVDPKVAGAEFAGRTLVVGGSPIASEDGGDILLENENPLLMNDPTVVTLDRPVTLATGHTYELNVVDDTGALQTRAITTTSGQTVSTLQINTAFDPQPTEGRMWSISGTDVEPRLFRITTIVEVEGYMFEVTGVEYNPAKHDYIDRDFKLSPVNFSRLFSGKVLPPENLDIVETLFKTNGVLRTRVNVGWSTPTDTRVTIFRVQYGLSNGGLSRELLTRDTSVELDDLEPGTYDFYVSSIAAAGESEAVSSEAHVILGKTAPPGDVGNLRADRRVNGVMLQWDTVPDLDLVGYEVRQGTNWDTSIYVGDVTGTTMYIALDNSAEITFLVRAKDQLNILSQNVSTITTSVISPTCPPVFTAVAQADYVLFRWTRTDGLDNKYEIRRGTSWSSSELIAESSSDELLVLDPQRDASYYWIRAKSTAGLYSGDARVAMAQRALIQDRNVILEYDNQNDGGAGLYPGYTFDMEQGLDDTLLISNGSTDHILLENGTDEISLESTDPVLLEGTRAVMYGEHYFTVDLGQTLRARNWLETTPVNVVGGGLTWEEWLASWEAPESQITWLPLGDLSTVQLQKVIAWKRAPLTEEAYAFTMNSTLVDVRGVTPGESVKVTYGPAKFEQGLVINDLTKVSYTVTLGSSFSLMFKFRLREILNGKRIFTVLKNNTNGERLEIGYDEAYGSLYYMDNTGNTLDLPIAVQDNDDFIFIGFVQADSSRMLYYKSEKLYTEGSAAASHAPMAHTFDRLYLYDRA